jgi:tetracycline 7-halogenase / FADH2 O2-dependent halogenase
MPSASSPRAHAHGAHGDGRYDVAVLGSGIAGTTLAACLARNGLSVLILEAGTHPRFAVGESTIPYTSTLLRVMAERYDVPELRSIASFEQVRANVSNNCGVKRNFGFLYHREGEPQNPREANEFPLPKITHTESHLFRQDVDAWMLAVAVKYGAEIRQQTRVVDVDIDDDGVTLSCEGDLRFRASFLADASGFRSPLAQKLDLREDPCRLRHRSRSLFTHMVGVTPYEEAHDGNPPGRWSEGTLHHLFEGGWMWVIPFDNHRRSTNPLCSVGLSLDPRIHPVPDCSPQEEFDRFLAKYPSVAKQFAGARSIRTWVRTGRIQYSSTRTIGPRWCLMSHAAGFIDALFSRGLSNTFEIVNALTWRLLDAVREDDFSVERFSYVEKLEQGLLDYNDELVANSYTSFRNYDLWNAYFRIWAIGQIYSTLELSQAFGRYLDTQDDQTFKDLERIELDAAIPEYPPMRALLRKSNELMQQVQAGTAEPGPVAEEIIAMLESSDFVPPTWGLTDPDKHDYEAKGLSALVWSRTQAPAEIGKLVYDGMTTLLRVRVQPIKDGVPRKLASALPLKRG